MTGISTWRERAEAHPDHQSGMISEDMIRARMEEEIEDLRAEIERTYALLKDLRAEIERTYALLKDPNVVSINMLRGVIAMPSIEQIRHIYQDRLLLPDLATVVKERDEARAAVERLREALQEATLAVHGCAQCRDEIGRICRKEGGEGGGVGGVGGVGVGGGEGGVGGGVGGDGGGQRAGRNRRTGHRVPPRLSGDRSWPRSLSAGGQTVTDKIAEIRARHEEGIRAGADADRAYLLAEVERLREENRILRASLTIDFEAAPESAEGDR